MKENVNMILTKYTLEEIFFPDFCWNRKNRSILKRYRHQPRWNLPPKSKSFHGSIVQMKDVMTHEWKNCRMLPQKFFSVMGQSDFGCHFAFGHKYTVRVKRAELSSCIFSIVLLSICLPESLGHYICHGWAEEAITLMRWQSETIMISRKDYP